ncbi:hypothetical protein GE21DRAFT_1307940 [Neurospora crassa]|nr:hypothetical protein B1D4.320 [imported] - Neurospora crassa [Neurospora crassa]KHE85328.1 hypothetical protein GE21DRAFT_1307940 [Neurospora crassa]
MTAIPLLCCPLCFCTTAPFLLRSVYEGLVQRWAAPGPCRVRTRYLSFRHGLRKSFYHIDNSAASRPHLSRPLTSGSNTRLMPSGGILRAVLFRRVTEYSFRLPTTCLFINGPVSVRKSSTPCRHNFAHYLYVSRTPSLSGQPYHASRHSKLSVLSNMSWLGE